MSGGSSFQSRGAATLNARSPNLSLVRGTKRSPFEADRSRVSLSRSDTDCSMSVIYVGAFPVTDGVSRYLSAFSAPYKFHALIHELQFDNNTDDEKPYSLTDITGSVRRS